jgi:hypothetical protein
VSGLNYLMSGHIGVVKAALSCLLCFGRTRDLSWFLLRRSQYLGYVASNGRMTDELERIWKEAVFA